MQDNLKNASVLLFDPEPNGRLATKNSLQALGFEKIGQTSSYPKLRKLLSEGNFDLLIAEATSPEGDVCGLIRQLRHDTVGRNPFLAVILTTWTPSKDLVKAVIDCGADDLITRPFSTNQIGDRVQMLIRARKHFVVTTDYIGPDRRRDPSRVSNVGLIEVPNSLKAKTQDAAGAAATSDAILATVATMNLQKIKRHDFQIGVLVQLILESYRTAAAVSRRNADLEKLKAVIDDLRRRVAKTEHRHVDAHCAKLAKTVEAVVEAAERPADGALARLEQDSMALHLALAPGKDAVAIAAEISTTIEKIRQRQANLAATGRPSGPASSAPPPAPEMRATA